MICPVCEHSQDFGVECEVCGKDLGGLGDLGAPPSSDEVVEGLEATIGERVGEVAVERVGELEVTSLSTGDVAVIEMDEMERTGSAPVGAVQAEPMIDLAEDRAPDDGVRTEAPVGEVSCRYCRHVQAEGLICDNCGMKLPKVAPAIVTVDTGKPKPSFESVRCRSCGAPAKPGQRCTDCGREVALPDA